ncbi:MAG: heme-binding domain-containing protein [Bryobacteraceae bacterium]
MTKKFGWLAAFSTLVLPFVHPFGPVRQQHSSNLLTGVQWDDPRVLPLFEKACQSCHAERTQWPLYAHLPLLSWALEKDVAEARRHMDLSRWDQYSVEQKRDLLARIGAEVRNRQMPLPRYVLLHREARLSDAEIQIIYEWTKTQRRSLRNQRE